MTNRERTVRLQFPTGLPRLFVSQAILGAASRLERADCQQVLEDFVAEDGGSLRDALGDAAQGDAARFLSGLWFVDGTDTRECLTRWSAAYTTPGSHVIYVCGSRFADTSASLQGEAGQMVIIHEMLHALGLGENPPSSAEITQQVTRRCGGPKAS